MDIKIVSDGSFDDIIEKYNSFIGPLDLNGGEYYRAR